jgi:hypothetical protein
MTNHSKKVLDDIFISFMSAFWVIVAPILTYLGYVKLLPVDSSQRFWFFMIFGIVLVAIASVPIVYAIDPITNEFVNQSTGERLSIRKVLVSRDSIRGIGIGFICHSLGGIIDRAWNYWELAGVVIGVVALIKGFSDLIFKPRKFINDVFYYLKILLAIISVFFILTYLTMSGLDAKPNWSTVVAAITILLAPILLLLWVSTHRIDHETRWLVSLLFGFLTFITITLLYRLYSSPDVMIIELEGWIVPLLIIETSAITYMVLLFVFLFVVPPKERVKNGLDRGLVFGLLGYAITFIPCVNIDITMDAWWITPIIIGFISGFLGGSIYLGFVMPKRINLNDP